MESVSFTLGECFISYRDLEEKINLYENSRCVQMTRRDSRTLEAARKRVPKRVEGANEKLIYYSLHFTCLFGGKNFKSKSSKDRKRQSTLKIGCSAGFKLNLSDDQQSLKVVEVNENHNHEISKDIYDNLPRQRRREISTVTVESTKTALSQHQKFRKAQSLAAELSSLISEVGMAEFEQRMSALRQLRDTWSNGLKATVQAVHIRDEDDINSVEENSESLPSEECAEEKGNEECNEDCAAGLKNIKLPPKMRKRSRPKGTEISVIGRPRKREKISKPVHVVYHF